MKYISTITVSAIALGVLSLSVGGGRLSKHCRQIISLLLILTVVMPFLKGVETSFTASPWEGSIPSPDTSVYEENLAKLCEKRLEESVTEALSDRFDIDADKIKVDIETDSSDTSNILITEVWLELTDHQYDKALISNYLKELLLCDNVNVK